MRKGILVAGTAFVLALAGLGLWWYVAVPHTPEQQFAVADKLDAELQKEAVTKSAKELGPKIDATVEQYKRVWTRFGKNAKAPEAMKRIAVIEDKIEKDRVKEMAQLEQLGKEYTEEENAGFALREEARLLKEAGNDLKPTKPEDAATKYREAIAKLEEFRKTFDKSKDGDAALMEMGRIWQDNLVDPLINAKDIFTQVLKDYPHSAFEDEAMYRLAKQYEKMKLFPEAVQVYAQLIEQYPGSKYAADATYSRGKLLADEMDKHEEAAKDFEKVAQDFPNDPHSGTAGQEAQAEREKAQGEKGEQYSKGRYGGSVPVDTMDDKALPPSELLKQFTVQKLDALNYDLNVTFVPGEHRITVEGTLKLTNRGEEKKDLLLMLGHGLTISKLTFNGVEAKSQHGDDALKIALPTPMAKDATGELAFTYTGQYADAEAMQTLKPGAGGGMKGSKKGKPATAPATAPATGPAAATAPEAGPATGPAEAAASMPAGMTVDPQMSLGTFGYALSGASWYPITIIGDVFDAHVTLNTPENVEAVANGEVIKREKSTRAGTEGHFEFKTKNPVFGLYFAYGPYTVQDKQVGAIHFYTYMRPQNAGKHDAYVEVANRILSFYSSKFDGFPFEKMAIIDTPLPPFLGGVGPASLMFLQGTMVDHAEVPENLLAHELAHQWFGNLIPINITDANYNQWLSEGFATYCDALYTEHRDGAKAFQVHIQQYQQLYFQFAMVAPKGSGAIKDMTSMNSALYRPVVYEKGALVLHMLRKVMGDDKFFQTMLAYVQQYKNKPSNTDDFRRLASEIYGSDLSWFFGEWYDRSMFAHWTLKVDVKADSGGGAVTNVVINQPDDLIVMPADVTFMSAQGDRVVVKNVMLDKKENKLEQKTPFVPVKVIVDEDGWVLKRLGSDNIWAAPGGAPAPAATSTK